MAVPGSQAKKVDIAALGHGLAAGAGGAGGGGGAMLPGAQRITCNAGDVIIHARNVVHGSAANTSDTIRATLYLGFLPSASCETLHSAHDIQARQALVRAQYVPARVASGWYPREEPFVYSGLSDADFEAIQAAGHNLLDGARFPLLQI